MNKSSGLIYNLSDFKLGLAASIIPRFILLFKPQIDG